MCVYLSVVTDGRSVGSPRHNLSSRAMVLCVRNQDQAGNFPTVTRMLLGKIDDTKPGRVSYVYDQYMFHYLVRF